MSTTVDLPRRVVDLLFQQADITTRVPPTYQQLYDFAELVKQETLARVPASPGGHSADPPALRELTDEEVMALADQNELACCHDSDPGVYQSIWIEGTDLRPYVLRFARALLAAARKP